MLKNGQKSLSWPRASVGVPRSPGRPQHVPRTLWACQVLCLVIRRRSRGTWRPSLAPTRPQGEEQRIGTDHPGSTSGSEIFWKFQKIHRFSKCFVCIEILTGYALYNYLSLKVRRRLRWEQMQNIFFIIIVPNMLVKFLRT